MKSPHILKKQQGRVSLGTRLGVSAIALSTLAVAVQAHAFSFDTGNPDIRARLDTQVRYNLGIRVEDINDDFGNSPTYDATEHFAGQGDLVTNRLDVLSELDLVYKNRHGVRVSAAAWRDFAYDNPKYGRTAAQGFSKEEVSEHENAHYSSYANRYHKGLSGEILDAFVFTGFDIGSVSADFKLGQHTIYWGESLYTPFHGISYSQAPLDLLKAASSPGIEAKEMFMPIPQVSFQASLTDTVSIAGQYLFDWEPSRLPAGGTYFGAADAMRADYVTQIVPGVGVMQFPFGSDVEPNKKRGQFGLNLRWTPDWLRGTVGVYYRKFNEVMPWSTVSMASGGPLPDDMHLAFASDTKLYGLSLTKTVGVVSVGAEVSYRENTALNTTSGPWLAVGDARGIEGARGDTWHALVNGIYMLPKTRLWTGGSLQAELVYSALDHVTKNEELFRGVGYGGCAGQGAGEGCSTREVWLAQVGFTPEYPQAFPGVNLSLPMSLSYGLKGNGATLGGGNQDAMTWSVGVQANIYNTWDVSLKYNDSRARYSKGADGLVSAQNGNALANDHGWVSLMVKRSF